MFDSDLGLPAELCGEIYRRRLEQGSPMGAAFSFA